MHNQQGDSGGLPALILTVVVIAAIVAYRRRAWKPACTAFGTARWLSDPLMLAAGMLAEKGLILGRTFGGKLIRLPRYCHILLAGGTGSGKGVGIIIPNLLSYFGS